MNEERYAHGPEVTGAGIVYRLWSPSAGRVAVMVEGQTQARSVDLLKGKDGWFSGLDAHGKVGDRYWISIDGKKPLPDAASRFQPQGVKGPSQVVEAKTFAWHDQNWEGPGLDELVIYETHVGTFTRGGTFESAIKQFTYVRELGANAIQLMPVGEFPGEHNWGYDVVLPYAPAHSYGTPDDLRRLVDAAHGAGFAVVLDVVYNHVCGEPNILQSTAPEYFHQENGNAWGSSFNFDGPGTKAVREFFIQNAIYWLEEFHVDGLRLDATHAIRDESPLHVLREIADAVHKRGGFVIAENDHNDARLLRPKTEGGLGLDAAWADDFHHVMKMKLKPEPVGHFASYRGSLEELRDTVEHGWRFRGQVFPQWQKPRGTECRDRPPRQFVYCISNHDQVGNRPAGERLNQLVEAGAYRAASLFFLLLPYTPMLFMGQEWAAETPFVFFTNHGGKFGKGVSEGRLREFKNFGSAWPAEMIAAMPDPESESAFERSKLNWAEVECDEHRRTLALYRECLRLRKKDPVLKRRERDQWKVWVEAECIFLQYGPNGGASRLLMACFEPTIVGAKIGAGWQIILSSAEERFGGAEKIECEADVVRFRAPATVVLGREA